MSNSIYGSCQCGYVTYAVNGEPTSLNVCHCLDCQKQSGSAFGMSLVIEPDHALVVDAEGEELEDVFELGVFLQGGGAHERRGVPYHPKPSNRRPRILARRPQVKDGRLRQLQVPMV